MKHPGPLLRRSARYLGQRSQALWHRREVRELLLWCLPALFAGLILRCALTVEMPYGLYHDDTPDFLRTPDKLLNEHKFDLHSKKTFLVPSAFTIPFLLKVPALIAIPVAQHLLGLAQVVLVGLLCRLWFRRWKLFIVPITLAIAINPFLLWYEHTLMAETVFVFCTVLVAVAGTLYARAQTVGRFVFLCGSLVLEAGARPEGKLLFAFGFLLLFLLHYRQLRTVWPRLAAIVAIGAVTHLATKTSQAGLLLYTSVVRITPENLRVAPGFNAYIEPLQKDLQNRWEEHPSFPKVQDRRIVSESVKRYLKESAASKEPEGVNDLCLKLAFETCIRNAGYLPILAYHKFRYVANEDPSGRVDEKWLVTRQRKAYLGTFDRTVRLSKGLTGREMSSEEEVKNFVEQHYREVQWFDAFSDRWLSAVNRLRLPDRTYADASTWDGKFVYPGLPLYFLLALVGLLVAGLRTSREQRFHLAWGAALLGFFFVVMLTANVRSRFRVAFEPFWFIYIGLLIDVVASWSKIRLNSSTRKFLDHSVSGHSEPTSPVANRSMERLV